jgi:hypothetical protein
MFDGEMPDVDLTFEIADKRSAGQARLLTVGSLARWTINLNPIALSRPLYEVLVTLVRELTHVWQNERGSPSRPPHRNREFRDKCGSLGLRVDERGHVLGIQAGTRFDGYCRAHGVELPRMTATGEYESCSQIQPLLSPPPAQPTGSRLKKWSCQCGINVRVAVPYFDATCNRCGERFVRCA